MAVAEEVGVVDRLTPRGLADRAMEAAVGVEAAGEAGAEEAVVEVP